MLVFGQKSALWRKKKYTRYLESNLEKFSYKSYAIFRFYVVWNSCFE